MFIHVSMPLSLSLSLWMHVYCSDQPQIFTSASPLKGLSDRNEAPS